MLRIATVAFALSLVFASVSIGRSLPEARVAGPHGTPLGTFSFVPFADETIRVAGPFVHSVTDTTVNIEWWASEVSDYELVLLEDGQRGEPVRRHANKAASFSLTGLTPGKRYVLSFKADKPIRSIGEDGALAEPVESLTVSFTTEAVPHKPAMWYVATDGDNAATGRSPDDAWRTVSHAADRVRPGDTVILAGGVYAESVRLRVTGEADRPITFRAARGQKVVFDGLGRTLNHAFMGADKHHLRFDGFYFTGIVLSSDSTPFIGTNAGHRNGCFTLYECNDVQITRCLLDGRGPGYSPGIVFAMHCRQLVVRNCVMINTMGGAVTIFWDSAGARVQNNVFLRSLIQHTGIHIWPHRAPEPEDACYLENNIFTDNLRKKLHVPLLGGGGALVTRNNCFYLRVPADQRTAGNDKTVADFIRERAEKWPGRENIVADPMFRVAADMPRTDEQGERVYLGDRIYMVDKLDFHDLFTTNPKLIERDIGLQREAFEDFHFNQETPEP